MKKLLLLISLFACKIVHSQNIDSLIKFSIEKYSDPLFNNHDSLLVEFKSSLRKDTNNPKLYYFLAHFYSKSKYLDATKIPEYTYDNVSKTSQYLEQVIKLDPSYNSPLIILDPYSKIQSEWGTLALKYFYHNDFDSVNIALLEGKKRGAFKPFWCDLAKLYLDACSEESILVTSGDNIFYSIFYVQQIEKYRTDVHVLDMGLSLTSWYNEMLVKRNLLNLTHEVSYHNIPLYKKWDKTVKSIYYTNTDSVLEWVLPPTYGDYQLRNSAFLLDVLEANEFANDVYFVDVLPERDILALYDHLQFLGVVYKVVPKIPTFKEPDNWEEYLQLSDKVFFKSQDQINAINQIRLLLYQTSFQLLESNKGKAQLIFEKTELKIPINKYPIHELPEEWRTKTIRRLNTD